MPAVWRSDTDTLLTDRSSSVGVSFDASRTLEPRADASVRASALPNGQRALTPIIAGTISGTCIAVAWLVALVHLTVKHYRRRKRYKKLGAGAASIKSAKEQEERRRKEYIVPPDPAVLEGSHYPGERVVLEKHSRWWKGKGKRRPRRRASSSGNVEFSSGPMLTNGSDSGSSGGGANGKGKERASERPPSPRRTRTAPDHRRHSFSGSWRSQSYQSNIPKVAEEEEETLELRPQPFYKLSTIISASDSQQNVQSIQPTLPPPLPPKEDSAAPVPGRSDVQDADFSTNDDDVSLVQHSAILKPHKYPPSRLR
ncbi:hypothetical protein A7U60_g3432 [Sanghuangporus baumii]|uniref:Uncharacterized protein n=1 Tax=Sanghuangporus baumii TaxID=108892 RepID=A0A9Q5N6T5_SANBA|nr:hypothetical protein A7U60_g3432 [Sanghuangporus baumii]